MNLPFLDVTQGAEAVAACIRANRVPFLLGSPGTVKTSLMRIVAKALKMPCAIMTLANYEASDIAGLPVKHIDEKGNLVVQRIPFKKIRDAADSAVILFLDEITSTERSVEGPAMRLALERFAGDDLELHEGTRIVLAGNFPDETPRGRFLTPAMTNRLIVLNMRPSLDNCVDYFSYGAQKAAERPTEKAQAIASVSDDELKNRIRIEQADFAATLGVKTDLICMTPPETSKATGSPWGSPRAWEIGLDAYAALGRSPALGKDDDIVGYSILAGTVGPERAAGYLEIRKLRKDLPSIEEIVKDPFKTLVPAERDHEIAILGLLPRIWELDAGAAVIYSTRLSPEIQGAASSVLFRIMGPQPYKTLRDSKFINAGSYIATLLANTHKVVSGQVKLGDQQVSSLLVAAYNAISEETRNRLTEN